MEPIFVATCNCLYDSSNLSAQNLDQFAKRVRNLGIPFDANTITSSVERFGNWVGGQVYVFPDQIVFSMNMLNARFQHDVSDVIFPTSMIGEVKLGKMLMVAKTVDCEFMGTQLRFRCNGKNNDRLLDRIRSVTAR